jgi:hypothetical protein
MTIDGLRDAIENVLGGLRHSKPFDSPIAGAKGVRLKRYIVGGIPVGHEHTTSTVQNIWVRRDDVRLSRLIDIAHKIKTADELKARSGANSNLFAVGAFRDRDLIRFGVKSEAEAFRVLSEACL